MPEAVAVVGSRQGADLEAVKEFVHALHAKQPDTLLVSGGADGVDKVAEREWLELGGQVRSYRVRELGPQNFMVEQWDLGGPDSRCFVLVDHPSWANRMSAFFYRNMLIAEHSDRVVVFFRRGKSSGAGTTIDFAKAYGKHAYEFEAAA